MYRSNYYKTYISVCYDLCSCWWILNAVYLCKCTIIMDHKQMKFRLYVDFNLDYGPILILTYQ